MSLTLKRRRVGVVIVVGCSFYWCVCLLQEHRPPTSSSRELIRDSSILKDSLEWLMREYNRSNNITCAPANQEGVVKVLRDKPLYRLNHMSHVWGSEKRACRPHHNIGFLKTHKAASSAIQNLFFRYGLKHNLLFAVPKRSNCYLSCLKMFREDMFWKAPWSVLGINIFAIHTQWNHAEIAKIMPGDTMYVSIVREPADVFESYYNYMDMPNTFHMSAEKYALNKPTITHNKEIAAEYNQMVYDFGLPREHIYNHTKLTRMLSLADRQFQLVMVVERMEESLVLLAHLLCWDLTDVIILKTNFRSTKFRTQLTEAARTILQDKLAPDYLLYRHFLHKLDSLVDHFGRERMAQEVKRLRELTERLVERCGFNSRPKVDPKKDYSLGSKKVERYSFKGKEKECGLFAMEEIAFVKLLRDKQNALMLDTEKKYRERTIGKT